MIPKAYFRHAVHAFLRQNPQWHSRGLETPTEAKHWRRYVTVCDALGVIHFLMLAATSANLLGPCSTPIHLQVNQNGNVKALPLTGTHPFLSGWQQRLATDEYCILFPFLTQKLKTFPRFPDLVAYVWFSVQGMWSPDLKSCGFRHMCKHKCVKNAASQSQKPREGIAIFLAIDQSMLTGFAVLLL